MNNKIVCFKSACVGNLDYGENLTFALVLIVKSYFWNVH